MELITTKICMKLDLGVHGNMFGGNLLQIIDESSAAYACQICHSQQLVTKKIEELTFDQPIKEGNIIAVYGEVDRIGTSSITIKLEVRKQSVHRDDYQVVCKTKIVFVRIDDEGKSIPITESVRRKYSPLKKESN